jgi:hypothetical protein
MDKQSLVFGGGVASLISPLRIVPTEDGYVLRLPVGDCKVHKGKFGESHEYALPGDTLEKLLIGVGNMVKANEGEDHISIG